MKLPLLLLALLAATVPALSAEPPLKADRFKLGDWQDDIGYSEAVRVGQTVYISGVTAGGDMPTAIREIYEGLRKTLAHYGLTFQHVVKENAYTTDLEALKANIPARRAYYGKEFPAATWVQVSRLYNPTDILEIELIAVIPE